MSPLDLPTASTISTRDVDVLVIGGGLSGLVAAYRSARVLTEHPRGGVITEPYRIPDAGNSDSFSSLSTDASTEDSGSSPKHPSLVLLEARQRLGGRICSVGGVDLGATWTWPEDDALQTLASTLGVDYYAQQTKGDVLVEQRGHIMRTPSEGQSVCGSSGCRFTGSASAFTEELRERLKDLQALSNSCRVDVLTCVAATSIASSTANKRVIVDAQRLGFDEGAKLRFAAKVVVIAAPPRVVVKTIDFSPPLDPEKKAAMLTCPTAMADAAKVVAFYTWPLWREKKLSGTAFMSSGPLTQIWDASEEGEVYALAGFVFGLDATDLAARPVVLAEVDGVPAKAFDSLPPILKRAIDQFAQIAGSKPNRISWKSWQDEPWTAAGLENRSRGKFGHPDLRRIKDGSIIFAGSETEPEEGHLEGAVMSGNRAAIEVFELLGVKSGFKPPK
mmetsp:Transcript_35333/g.75295  ORF Transcript_35333/g.75295 Transcript_35333/m.75295 type:complete len:446 (-) Transcript_35333:523-1860(-)